MQNILVRENFLKARYQVFTWRQSLAVNKKVLLALTMAILTGVLAQVKIFLPWTPVPITGQTFSVLMAGILLGANWGAVSQLLYVAIGVAGVPWFADGKGGYAALFGPTGGYLLGFVLAALFLGYMTDKHCKARNFIPMTLLMLFSNFILIYIPGLIHLGFWGSIAKGTILTFKQVLAMGAVPFILGDLIKIITAAAVTKIIIPKEKF